jgi:hypothetical protein
MPTDEPDPRYKRHEGLIASSVIAQNEVSIIGVGAIGRQVALMLASIGVQKIQLIDHDIVEETNIATQGYKEEDLDSAKVVATMIDCFSINSKMEVMSIAEKWEPGCLLLPNVFCCVDSIDTRAALFADVRGKCNFFVDGRMAAEAMRILSVTGDTYNADYYESTLFDQSDAYPASCTARSTVYCAQIAAGMMVSQFTKKLRNYPVDWDISFNLLANEIVVKDECSERTTE